VAFRRQVLHVEPVASIDADALRRVLSPILQRYFTEPLDAVE
jgi:hypothetical protein